MTVIHANTSPILTRIISPQKAFGSYIRNR